MTLFTLVYLLFLEINALYRRNQNFSSGKCGGKGLTLRLYMNYVGF